MKFHKFLFPLLAAFFTSCNSDNIEKDVENINTLEEGFWRVSLNIGEKELPFQMYITENNVAVIHNAEERIESRTIEINEDSVNIDLKIFNSSLKGIIDRDGLISGVWIKDNKKEKAIPFVAEHGKTYRFTPNPPEIKLAERYKVQFFKENNRIKDAVLLIENKDSTITATFLTETGDYRFLEGSVFNNRLYLSTFNGAYPLYFEAEIKNDSLINGVYLSGTSSKTEWSAVEDINFELRDPETLSLIKDEDEIFDFKLLNQNADSVTFSDMNLEEKVIIIDIMGSWCPNCLDATKALKEFEDKYSADLVVIPVAFERDEEIEKAISRVEKMYKDLDMNTKFLYGGKASTKAAEQAFPNLSKISSFPTLIFVDKNRKIRKVYSGFYGPGTGNYYKEFMTETDKFLQTLIAE